MPQPWLPQKGKLEKRLYFHRTVDMKQPHTRSLKKGDDTHSIIEIHYLCMECIPYKNVDIPYSTQYCRRILTNK